MIARYQAEKERRGLLDYEDLIDKTLDLFARSSAAWVLYKLDLGIDHVLIDEAQDTSPKQWKIIETIVAEFTPGGARPNVRRTLFAVGDDKQSIFSFQGAAPHDFDEMRRLFERQFDTPEQGWRICVSMHRSAPAKPCWVPVDRCSRRARLSPASPPTKSASRSIWRCQMRRQALWRSGSLQACRKARNGRLGRAFRHRQRGKPACAARAPDRRARQLFMTEGHKPGDILVLVRQRGPLFEAIIRALKTADIPVAGADRLVLTEHIAVMDLMVLADALLLPQDDLAVATVLRVRCSV